jgi:diguanylate cyclase (GGDEF)-like protein/PAS domain S-box-containing protein
MAPPETPHTQHGMAAAPLGAGAQEALGVVVPSVGDTADGVGVLQALTAFDPDPTFLADLASSIPGALYRIVAGADGTWRFTYLSPGIQDLYGIGAEDVLANPLALADCMWPQDRKGYRQASLEAYRQMAALHREYRISARDGQMRWIEIKAVPRRTPEGDIAWTGLMLDVSQRKRVEAALQASEATYRTLFETVPQGVVYHDPTGAITSANPAALRILGLTLDQLQGRTSMDPHWRAVREDGSPFPGDQHPAMVALQTGQRVRDVLMGVHVPDRPAGKSQVWILVNAVPLFQEGVLHQVYATFEDITERVLLTQEIRRQATTDFLTGAPNRRSFMSRLALEFDRVRRRPSLTCGLLALDLDHFKRVNDTWGHAAGDAVLCHLVNLVQDLIRSTDLLGRTGGEEFSVLLPDTPPAAVLAMAERLRLKVAHHPVHFEGQRIDVSLSIGASLLDAADADPDAALARADEALYAAKEAGRNAVRAIWAGVLPEQG